TGKPTADLIEPRNHPPARRADCQLHLCTHRVPAGPVHAADGQAAVGAALPPGMQPRPVADARRATELLGTMLGGFNISALIELLDHADLAPVAAEGLKKSLLVFDAFHDIEEKAKAGNAHAQAVLQSWADAEWFTSRPEVPQSL